MIKNYALGLMILFFGFVSAQETISFEASEGYQLATLNTQNGWEVTVDSDGNFLQNQVVTDEEASDGSFSFKNAFEPSYDWQWLPIFGAAKTFDTPKSYEDFVFSYDVMVTETLGADFELTLYGIDADEDFVPVAGFAMENQGQVYVISDITYGSDYIDGASWIPNTWYSIKIEVSAAEIKYYMDDVLIYTGDNFTSENIEGFNMLHNNYGGDAYYDNFVYANGTLSNKDFSELADLSIYPNPVENELNIQGLESFELERLSIYNMMGQQLLESTTAETLNVDQLSGGAYILEITTKENKSFTEKFIKR
ncbi:MAG: T9SS type A sorting domain-containing protein [Flavobacteriaceae bacterium]